MNVVICEFYELWAGQIDCPLEDETPAVDMSPNGAHPNHVVYVSTS